MGRYCPTCGAPVKRFASSDIGYDAADAVAAWLASPDVEQALLRLTRAGRPNAYAILQELRRLAELYD